MKNSLYSLIGDARSLSEQIANGVELNHDDLQDLREVLDNLAGYAVEYANLREQADSAREKIVKRREQVLRELAMLDKELAGKSLQSNS
jgi:hypothetical protein